MVGRRMKAWTAAIAVLLAAGAAAAQDQTKPSKARLKGAVRILYEKAHENREGHYLKRPMYYCENSTGRMYLLPAGFLTDLASVPPLLRDAVAADGRKSDAAIVHDYLYAVGEPGGKYEADRILLNALAETEVGGWTRDTMWVAVAAFGEAGYRSPADWMFVDPDTGVLEDPPRPKPRRVPYEQGRSCEEFPNYVRRNGGTPEDLATIRVRRSEVKVFGLFTLRPRVAIEGGSGR